MNLVNLAEELGSDHSEKVASKIIKNKMTKEGIKSGESFVLKSFGPSITAKIGRPENKLKRKSDLNNISLETIKKLQLNLELSKRGSKSLISTIRKSAKIESGIYNKLEEAEKQLSQSYSIKTGMFEINNNIEERNIILVKNVPEFIDKLIQCKGL